MGMAGETANGRAGGRLTMFWIALWLAGAPGMAKAAGPEGSFRVVAQTRGDMLHNMGAGVARGARAARAGGGGGRAARGGGGGLGVGAGAVAHRLERAR